MRGGMFYPIGYRSCQIIQNSYRKISVLSSLCSNINRDHEETHGDHVQNQRTVPISEAEHDLLIHRNPEHRASSKLLQVAVLGVPNTGKSTLTNQILKWKVCTVSKKVHTTRKNCKAVFMEDDTQVVFLDTPGLISTGDKEKHRLEKSLLLDPEFALVQSDMLLVVHDVSCKYTRRAIDPKVLRLLYKHPEKEAALVLNKVDLVQDKLRILDLTDELTEGLVAGLPSNKTTRLKWRKKNDEIDKDDLFRRMEQNDTAETQEPAKASGLTVEERMQRSIERKNMSYDQINEAIKDKKGWPNFSNVFMVSALYDDGVESLRRYLVESARPSPWLHSSSLVTDTSPLEIIEQTVKEKLLDHLPMELPYLLTPKVEFWDVSASGLMNIVVAIRPKSRHWVKLIVGAGGKKIRQISSEAEQDLRNTFRFDVRLKISVEEPRIDKNKR